MSSMFPEVRAAFTGPRFGSIIVAHEWYPQSSDAVGHAIEFIEFMGIRMRADERVLGGGQKGANYRGPLSQ